MHETAYVDGRAGAGTRAGAVSREEVLKRAAFDQANAGAAFDLANAGAPDVARPSSFPEHVLARLEMAHEDLSRVHDRLCGAIVRNLGEVPSDSSPCTTKDGRDRPKAALEAVNDKIDQIYHLIDQVRQRTNTVCTIL